MQKKKSELEEKVIEDAFAMDDASEPDVRRTKKNDVAPSWGGRKNLERRTTLKRRQTSEKSGRY